MKFDYDLFVIGAGSGGVRAARISASLGAKVAIAEERYLGGTCVNVGCIPKKLFVYGSHISEDLEDARFYGWNGAEASFDWPTLLGQKNREIARLNGIYHNLLSSPGVEIFECHAQLEDAHTINLGNHKVTSERILIATGSRPVIPEFEGSDLVATSDDAFYFEELPERVVIVGGGYIAVEFAGIYQGMGLETHLVYRGPLLLRGFDDQLREFVQDQLELKGIQLHLNRTIARVEQTEAGKLAYFDDGSTLEADEFLYATGRRPFVDECGVRPHIDLTSSGGIQVNQQFQTKQDNIYAIGDVIDRAQLTPVAIAEGMSVAHNLYAGENREVSYRDIPTAVFCQPNLGTVGPTEEEARKLYSNLHVYDSNFRPLKHTLTENPERTLMKLLVDAETDRVVGAHMVGPEAGEIIQGLAVAIKSGATKSDFDSTIAIHPTSAEEFVTMRERSR